MKINELYSRNDAWKIKYYMKTKRIQIFYKNKATEWIIPSIGQLNQCKQYPNFKVIPLDWTSGL